MPIKLDRTDKALLNALQGNARLTVAELAERVALTTSPCWRRVRTLEESGVISGYQAILSPKALGYGPAKAALIHFAEGLHLELAEQGYGVWLINPGFVATRLTAANDFAMPALLTPEQAAVFTVDGLAGGKFEITYPRRFTVWLKLLRCLPYRLYFPLVRRLTGG